MDHHDQLRDFGQVMLAHLDAAYNLARWLVPDARSAEDAVFEAGKRASRDFASYRGTCERSWLLGLVRENCHARLGRHAGVDDDRVGRLSADDVLEDGPARRHDATSLNDAIAALPVPLRECIVLRDIEGLSYAAMARVVNAPLDTVRTRLVRARSALQGGRAFDATSSDAATDRLTSCG